MPNWLTASCSRVRLAAPDCTRRDLQRGCRSASTGSRYRPPCYAGCEESVQRQVVDSSTSARRTGPVAEFQDRPSQVCSWHATPLLFVAGGDRARATILALEG